MCVYFHDVLALSNKCADIFRCCQIKEQAVQLLEQKVQTKIIFFSGLNKVLNSENIFDDDENII